MHILSSFTEPVPIAVRPPSFTFDDHPFDSTVGVLFCPTVKASFLFPVIDLSQTHSVEHRAAVVDADSSAHGSIPVNSDSWELFANQSSTFSED